MRNEDRIGGTQRVAAVARPGEIPGVRHHARPDWIQLDVALAGKQVAVRFDHGQAEAPFEERAGTVIRSVHLLHIALTEVLHEQRRPLSVAGVISR